MNQASELPGVSRTVSTKDVLLFARYEQKVQISNPIDGFWAVGAADGVPGITERTNYVAPLGGLETPLSSVVSPLFLAGWAVEQKEYR